VEERGSSSGGASDLKAGKDSVNPGWFLWVEITKKICLDYSPGIPNVNDSEIRTLFPNEDLRHYNMFLICT
jgi:hypothetical protein